jgi:hypothetical protein
MKKNKSINKKDLKTIQSKILGLMMQSNCEKQYVSDLGDKIVWEKQSHLNYEDDRYFPKTAIIQFADTPKNIYFIQESENGGADISYESEEYFSELEELMFNIPEEDVLLVVIQDRLDAFYELQDLEPFDY